LEGASIIHNKTFKVQRIPKGSWGKDLDSSKVQQARENLAYVINKVVLENHELVGWPNLMHSRK